ncbi:MAG: hypothetical protein KGM24_06200, partial [Elusimicrobia bacterium]|nr:hypothetical protein [Elusimicrobiota bacterium]
WAARPARGGARRWGLLALCAAGAAAFPYLLLGLRLRWGAPPVFNPDGVAGWGGVLGLALRRETGGLFSLGSGAARPASAGQALALTLRGLGWLGGLAWSDLTPAGLALSAWGAVAAWKKSRRDLVFWSLWLAGGLAFVALASPQTAYGDPDYLRAMMLRFDLLPLIALYALTGFGAQALATTIERRALVWLLVAAALAPSLLRPTNLSSCDPTLEYARALVADSGPRDMILTISDGPIFAEKYLDLVERATGDRVFLIPGRFSDPRYAAALKARHPDLNLPRDGAALSRRPARWLALNPGRALYGEPTLRDQLLRAAPSCAPRGLLIRAGGPPQSRAEDERQAAVFEAQTRAAYPPGCFPRPDTQEVYLAKAFAMMKEYYEARLSAPPARRR